MIVRGTTPTIRFTFKVIDPDTIVTAYFSVLQGTEVKLEKTLSEAQVGEDFISWTLTQEETLDFSDKKSIEFECRYRTEDGSAFVTKRMTERVANVIKDGVI